MKTTLTRKEFLRLALTAAGGALISACTQQPDPTPTAAQPLIITSTPKPEPTAAPQQPLSTATRMPATPTQPAGRLAGRPAGAGCDRAHARSRHHPVDRAQRCREAWKALFAPEERVAIKVNTIMNAIYWTHVPLVEAVTQRLVGAGLKPENILVYDRDTSELVGAGFQTNKDGPGVRCAGSEGRFSRLEKIGDYQVGISELFYDVDALINMPVLKTHSLAGFTFGLKNHYGTFDAPGAYHGARSLVDAVAGLSALPVIKDRTRLVIGDALTACLRESLSWPYWNSAQTGDSIFMSFDPVAHDAAGLEHFAGLLEADGGDTQFARKRSGEWLARAAELGVGTNDLSQIEILEEKLS